MSEKEMRDYLVTHCGYEFLSDKPSTVCNTFDELVKAVGKEKALLVVSEKNPAVASFFVKSATTLNVLLERYNWTCCKEVDSSTKN